MKTTKEALKAIGAKIRSRGNTEHEIALRTLLEKRMGSTEHNERPFTKRLYFLGVAMGVSVAVLILALPQSPLSRPVVPTSGLEDSLVLDSVSATAALGSQTTGAFAYIKDVLEDRVIDYENEHGSMLETSGDISLLTTKPISSEVTGLFTSLSGHVSSIKQGRSSNQTYITGFIPSKSYLAFQEGLRDLVAVDRYLRITTDAKDLIPQAITIDDDLTEVTEQLESRKRRLENTTDENIRASVQNEITELETKKAELEESKNDLQNEAYYTNVSISITEIPSFLRARSMSDIRMLVSGFKDPSFFAQLWINVLLVIALFLQALSFAFWLLIPLGIWWFKKNRERRLWRELE